MNDHECVNERRGHGATPKNVETRRRRNQYDPVENTNGTCTMAAALDPPPLPMAPSPFDESISLSALHGGLPLMGGFDMRSPRRRWMDGSSATEAE